MKTNKEMLADNNVDLDSCTKYKREVPLDRVTINHKLATIFSMKLGCHPSPAIGSLDEKSEKDSREKASVGYDDDY